MERSRLRFSLPIFLTAAALAFAACGGNDDNSGNGGSAAAVPPGISGPGEPVEGQKRGGHLTIVAAGDVDSLDPGQSYYSLSYQVLNPIARPLYSLKPESDGSDPQPDLADGEPKVSEDRKTVTIRIKKGVRYSPPYGRVVTSRDVKYAIERAFTPAVANGYVNSYFSKIVGVEAFKDGKAKEISGIETPDANTIVFRLTGGDLIGALVLPVTSPVPEAYAKRYDQAKGRSTYSRHLLATGPYMIDSYSPGKSIEIVRNPNWDPKTDYRPALLDRVTVAEGFDDAGVATRRVVNGRSQVSGDFNPPPDQLKSLATGERKDQLIVSPGTGLEFMSLNTTIKPLGNVEVRRAIAAALDREAMLRVRGGRLLGSVATHILYPTVNGFEEAGGVEGGGQDFFADPDGDLEVARSYMRKAGYETGRYTGGENFLMVAASTGHFRRQAQIAQRAVEQLGFKVKLRLVAIDTMYGKYCTVPKAKVAFCPTLGWSRDYPDGGAVLNPLYNPKNIVEEGNSVIHLYRGGGIGREIEAADAIPAGPERDEAWGEIDSKVTDLALNIPYIWDSAAVVGSANVQMVNQLWNQGSVDYAWSSLK